MAYNPGIQYRGDQYAFQGITGAASALAAGIDESRKKREQMEKEQALNDPIMKHAYENGQVSDEDYNAYVAAPHNKKQSMANGLMANIASDFAQRKFEAEQAQQQQEMALRLKIAQMSAGGRGGPAFAPPPEIVARLQEKGFEVMPTSRGGSQVIDVRDRKSDPYTMADLDKEVQLESGGHLADWASAEDQQVGKDGFRTAKVDDGKGGTKPVKIREDRYQAFANKYRALTGEAAPAVPAPAKTEDELADEWLARNPDSPFAEAVKKKRLGLQ